MKNSQASRTVASLGKTEEELKEAHNRFLEFSQVVGHLQANVVFYTVSTLLTMRCALLGLKSVNEIWMVLASGLSMSTDRFFSR